MSVTTFGALRLRISETRGNSSRVPNGFREMCNNEMSKISSIKDFEIRANIDTILLLG